MFWAEIRKISEFFIWKFSFFGGTIFSIYFNRRVFVMFVNATWLFLILSVCIRIKIIGPKYNNRDQTWFNRVPTNIRSWFVTRDFNTLLWTWGKHFPLDLRKVYRQYTVMIKLYVHGGSEISLWRTLTFYRKDTISGENHNQDSLVSFLRLGIF